MVKIFFYVFKYSVLYFLNRQNTCKKICMELFWMQRTFLCLWLHCKFAKRLGLRFQLCFISRLLISDQITLLPITCGEHYYGPVLIKWKPNPSQSTSDSTLLWNNALALTHVLKPNNVQVNSWQKQMARTNRYNRTILQKVQIK